MQCRIPYIDLETTVFSKRSKINIDFSNKKIRT